MLLVFWSFLVGLLFSRYARQYKFEKASIFIHFELCAFGTEVRSRCTLIGRRHAEQMETENRDFFASYRRQVV